MERDQQNIENKELFTRTESFWQIAWERKCDWNYEKDKVIWANMPRGSWCEQERVRDHSEKILYIQSNNWHETQWLKQPPISPSSAASTSVGWVPTNQERVRWAWCSSMRCKVSRSGPFEVLEACLNLTLLSRETGHLLSPLSDFARSRMAGKVTQLAPLQINACAA